MSAMTVTSLSGCGTQTSATNVQISEENRDETVVPDEEEIVVNNESESDTENADLKGNEDFVFYDEQQGVSEKVDLSNLTVMEPAIELHFNENTDVYDVEGNLVGYVKAGAYVAFHNYNETWSSFELNGTDMLMRMEDLQKNAVNEAVAEAVNQGTPTLAEDVTDGNIVLYGGKKYPDKYMPLDNNDIEEISIELTNVEAEIPIYSGEGRLCGHLNEGGNIVLTGHCTPATGWYRFENPIEGTEYEYLYMLTYEVIMSGDEKERIENALLDTGVRSRIKILDAPESDMECYEFSIAREKYSPVADNLYSDKFTASDYKTFYVECARNGDYFDCKIYYK